MTSRLALGLLTSVVLGCPTLERPPDPVDPPPELCDGLDNDGDGVPGPEESDSDGDGVIDCADCSPLDALAFPGAVESRSGIDDDCDGYVDEALDQPLTSIDWRLLPVEMGLPLGVQVVPPNVLFGSAQGVWVARDQALTDAQLILERVAPEFAPGPGPRMHWLFPGLGTTELGGITMGPDGAFWAVRGDGAAMAGRPLDLRPLLPPELDFIGGTLEGIAVSTLRTIPGLPGTALWHGGGGLARVRNLGDPAALEIVQIELPGGYGVANLTTGCDPEGRTAVILLSTGTIDTNGYMGIVDVETASVRWMGWLPEVWEPNRYHPFDWLVCLPQPDGPPLLAATGQWGPPLQIGSTVGAIEAADMSALLDVPQVETRGFGTEIHTHICSPGDLNGDGYPELVASGQETTLFDGRALGRYLVGEVKEAELVVSSWAFSLDSLHCHPESRSVSGAPWLASENSMGLALLVGGESAAAP